MHHLQLLLSVVAAAAFVVGVAGNPVVVVVDILEVEGEHSPVVVEGHSPVVVEVHSLVVVEVHSLVNFGCILSWY